MTYNFLPFLKIFAFISQVCIKVKTNKTSINKTVTYEICHKLKTTLCKNKINFHYLLEDNIVNIIISIKAHYFF